MQSDFCKLIHLNQDINFLNYFIKRCTVQIEYNSFIALQGILNLLTLL